MTLHSKIASEVHPAALMYAEEEKECSGKSKYKLKIKVSKEAFQVCIDN